MIGSIEFARLLAQIYLPQMDWRDALLLAAPIARPAPAPRAAPRKAAAGRAPDPLPYPTPLHFDALGNAVWSAQEIERSTAYRAALRLTSGKIALKDRRPEWKKHLTSFSFDRTGTIVTPKTGPRDSPVSLFRPRMKGDDE